MENGQEDTETAVPLRRNPAVPLELLDAGHRLRPDRFEVGRFMEGLYATAVDLAGRLLQEVEDGGGDAAWAYRVLEEQLPTLRQWAGLDGASPLVERERELREQYGLPVPPEVEVTAVDVLEA